MPSAQVVEGSYWARAYRSASGLFNLKETTMKNVDHCVPPIATSLRRTSAYSLPGILQFTTCRVRSQQRGWTAWGPKLPPIWQLLVNGVTSYGDTVQSFLRYHCYQLVGTLRTAMANEDIVWTCQACDECCERINEF